MRIAFWTSSELYFGGINYISNLILAVNSYCKFYDFPSPHFFIFVSSISYPYWRERLGSLPCVSLVTVPFISHPSLKLFSTIARKITNFSFIEFIYLKLFSIDILSHSIISAFLPNVVSIGWIPDFNHFFIPGWSDEHRSNFKRIYSNVLNNSKTTILSSQDAFDHFKIVFPDRDTSKLTIVPFFLDPSLYLNQSPLPIGLHALKPYCVIPNQFWPHKNHSFLIENLPHLFSKYPDFSFVFVGNFNADDSSQVEIFESLQLFSSKYDNIHVFSGIPYSSLISLISNSCLLINPSKFEGWSTTVMEAMVLQTPLLLSDINVHFEQTSEYKLSYLFDLHSGQAFLDGFDYIINRCSNFSDVIHERSEQSYLDFGKKMYQIYQKNV